MNHSKWLEEEVNHPNQPNKVQHTGVGYDGAISMQSLIRQEEAMDVDDMAAKENEAQKAAWSDKAAAGGARPKTGQSQQPDVKPRDKGYTGPSSMSQHRPSQQEVSNVVEYLWPKLRFKLTDGESKIVQSSLDIGKVQFSLTGERKDLTIETLLEKNITLSVQEDYLEVSVAEPIPEAENAMQYVEEMFQKEIIYKYKNINLEARSPEKLKVLQKLKEKVPKNIKFRKVAVYISELSDVLSLVGEMSYFEEALRDLGLRSVSDGDTEKPVVPPRIQPRVQTIPITFEESMLLGYLDFEQYLKDRYQDTEANVTQDPPLCVITSTDVVNGQEEMQRFFSGVESERIHFDDTLCYKLLFEKDGYPNNTVYLYVQSILNKKQKQSNVKPKFYMQKYQSGVHIVYSRNKQHACDVARTIENCIIFCEVAVASEKLWEILDSWKRRRKLIYIKKSAHTVVLCCTLDIHEELIHGIELQQKTSDLTMTLSELEAQFLMTFGKDVLNDMSKKFEVKTSFEDSVLKVNGNHNKLYEFEEYLKGVLQSLTRSIPLHVQKECFESRQSEIEKVMQTKECCWKIQTLEEPEKVLQDHEYLASLIDPLKELKITILRGCPWYLDVDLQIVMTNQCLYPLELGKFPASADGKFIEKGKHLFAQKKYKVGEYTPFIKDVKTEEANLVVGLVVHDESRKDVQVIEGKWVKQKVCEILKFGIHRKLKTVCISVSEPTLKFVMPCVEATLQSIDTEKESPIQELFICCKNVEEKLLREVKKLFKSKRGYSKKIYSDEAGVLDSGKDSGPQVKVVVGSLHETKADVLVNTTSANLQLNSGHVSKAVLQMAGSSLLKECHDLYPTGIADGRIAVTGAHKLKSHGFKLIYHTALKVYNFESFQQEIRSVVKLCLYQAEKNECSRIAFPAFGVGNLLYPRRETAAAMFDGVEDFCNEALNPKISKVFFVVHESDQKTVQAFLNEQWRRSKSCAKEIDISRPNNAKDIISLEVETKHISVRIAMKENFGLPKSYAVAVFFGRGDSACKEASTPPKSWNDQLLFDEIENNKQFAQSLRNCFKTLNYERVTEAVFYTSSDTRTRLPQGEQVKVIVDVIREQKENSIVKKVTILVSDESGLVNAAQCLRIEEQLKDEWPVKRPKEQKLSLELVGKTKGSLDDAEQFVTSLVQKINGKDTIKALPRHSTHSDVANRDLTKSVNGASPDKDVTKIADEVIAELNPGIVRYKKKSNDWHVWISKVEKVFHLKAVYLKDTVQIKGSFRNILKFEHYLENSDLNDLEAQESHSDEEFVSLPMSEDHYSQDKRTTVFIDMSDVEYCACLRLCKLEEVSNPIKYDPEKQGLVITCREESANAIESRIVEQLKTIQKLKKQVPIQNKLAVALVSEEIQKIHDKVNVFCCVLGNNVVYITGLDVATVEIAMQEVLQLLKGNQVNQFSEETKQNDMQNYQYKICDINIHLGYGDIIKNGGECIVVPCSTNYSRVSPLSNDILGKLAATGGDLFIQKCKESFTKYGTLGSGKCRVLQACGLEPVEKVILVYIPYFKEVHSQSLQMYEDTLVNILRTADSHGVRTVTLPLLASDKTKGGFGPEMCAEGNVKALKRMEKTNTLENIVVLDKNKNFVEIIKQRFDSRLTKVCSGDKQLEEACWIESEVQGADKGLLLVDSMHFKAGGCGKHFLTSAEESKVAQLRTDVFAGGVKLSTGVLVFFEIGNAWELETDAIICFVHDNDIGSNEEIRGNFSIFCRENQAMRLLMSDRYESKRCSVFIVSTRDSKSYAVLHTVLGKTKLDRIYEGDVKDSMKEVVCKAEENNCSSLVVELPSIKDKAFSEQFCWDLLECVLEPCQSSRDSVTLRKVLFVTTDSEIPNCVFSKLYEIIQTGTYV